MDDAKARGLLGTAGTAAFLGGLGVLAPGWNDLLLGLANRVAGTDLYELPPALSWVLLTIGVLMLVATFFGPARLGRWLDGQRAAMRAGSIVVMRHLGFLPAVRAPQSDELPGFENVEIIDVPIDLAARLQADDLEGALAEHQTRMTALEAIRAAHPQASFAYAGIVQAPFQVLAGYRLSNWAAATLLEWDRAKHSWRPLRRDRGPDLGLRRTQEAIGTGADVAVALEISYPITSAAIAASVPAAGHIVRLSLAAPRLDALTHIDQATSVATEVRSILDEFAARLGPGCRVHLFIAGPMSAGFRVGQMISRTMHPLVHIYAYTMNAQPPYPWGILINPPAGAPVVVRP